MKAQPQIDLSAFQKQENDFANLSLKDLVTARDLFHVHLMRHPNVVATANLPIGTSPATLAKLFGPSSMGYGSE